MLFRSRDVLRFAREEPGELQPVKLNDLLQRALQLTRRRADHHHVRLEFLPGTDLPALTANPTQIEQALVSILDNAIQASSSGQTVHIQTESTGAAVRARIHDEGRGMGEREREHAFDPFYTNRGREGGVGMGLSMAHGIVTDHGGTIEIVSQPGQGTTISVELPVT